MKELNDEKIWAAITNSAKKRFDYASFTKKFPFVTDKIILKIIINLGSKKEKDTIALQVHNDIWEATSSRWDIDFIRKFIDDKDEVFKREIYAAGLFGNLLHEGGELDAIYYEVSKFILTDE